MVQQSAREGVHIYLQYMRREEFSFGEFSFEFIRVYMLTMLIINSEVGGQRGGGHTPDSHQVREEKAGHR